MQASPPLSIDVQGTVKASFGLACTAIHQCTKSWIAHYELQRLQLCCTDIRSLPGKKASLVSHSRFPDITQILADLAAAPQSQATATADEL